MAGINDDRGVETELLLADEAESGSRPHKSRIDWVATGFCFIFPALGGLLFGYDIGATSGVLVSLTSPTLSGTDWYDLDAVRQGLVISMSLFGALAGSVATLAAGNRLGRRTELIMASALYGSSAILIGSAQNFDSLILGRVLYGLGIGFAMHSAPAYIAETSPPAVRGLLISLKEAFIVGGILLGYLTSYFFIDDVGGWRNMYAIAAPLALLLGAGMASLPESPRWLLLAGRGREEAVRALVRAEGSATRSGEAVEADVAAMMASLSSEERSGDSVFSLLLNPRYRRPLAVGTSLMLLQQITGQPSVLYYAARIFEDVGFAAGQQATSVSVVLGAFKLLMTLVAVLTVDKSGRRPLLLLGVSGMTAALLLLSAAQGGVLGDTGGLAPYVSAAALLIYVGCYQISFGPISWLIVGEVFPLAVRGQAIAVATFTNFGSNFLVSLALPSLQQGVGMPATYAVFAVVGVMAVALIYSTVPETKGKTLEEIEQMWGDKKARAPTP